MRPSEWSRSSRMCRVPELGADATEALRAYFEGHELGDLGAQALACCETTAQAEQRRWLGFVKATRTIVTGAFVTPRWLVWVLRDGDAAPTVVAARLAEVEITDYKPTLIDDHGLSVLGTFGGQTRPGTIFVGLGRDPAGEEFKRIVKDTARAARPA